MVRWEPGADERLRAAAMELYVEQGFEQTTVAEIADRAGVTSRTFFRYFADKREVLFAGTTMLYDELAAGLAAADDSASTMDAVRSAIGAVATVLGQRHEHSSRRHQVIVANAELQERELVKMAGLSAALAEGLRARGVAARDAGLAAEVGIAVLRVAFESWVTGSGSRRLTTLVRHGFDRLDALTSVD